jgi:hypothetical protein
LDTCLAEHAQIKLALGAVIALSLALLLDAACAVALFR